jgi:hypothetical protein
MSDPKNPRPGDRHVDASDYALVDLTPEYLQTLTKLRAGYERAVANVARLTPAQLKAAGISPEDAAALVFLTAEHQQLGVLYAAAAKLAELLHETRMERGHTIATRLAEAAQQARRRAQRSVNGPAILGPVAELLDYQLGPAMKALATRTRAKAGQEKMEEAGQAGGEAAP